MFQQQKWLTHCIGVGVVAYRLAQVPKLQLRCTRAHIIRGRNHTYRGCDCVLQSPSWSQGITPPL